VRLTKLLLSALVAGMAAILVSPGTAHASTDYGPAAWVPANSGNYTVANRESDYNINYVVIHTTQGSYNGTISWIQNPASQVSAHYVVRSSDGAVTQMVREKDIAWHAGNWSINTQAIGIEHEGWVEQDGWYTEAMYQSSAAIVRSVTAKYSIPRDRAHIIAHSEVPGATHTDPGPRWNWTYFMSLVNQTPVWSSTVDNTTAGRFSASANWGTSSYSTQRFGADYRYANPQAVSDPAWYRFDIPATANYRVEVWYPALPGYSTSAPYHVVTSSGNQVVFVDQRSGGGAWRNLGTFNLAAGDYNAVGVSRWTSGAGLVIADAVRLTRV
jgi:N-acetyl-anhydromuramyl-L-alanine amidase AmpD